ncbi:hypothetical protein BGZ94_001538, partial [Podila epigama]
MAAKVRDKWRRTVVESKAPQVKSEPDEQARKRIRLDEYRASIMSAENKMSQLPKFTHAKPGEAPPALVLAPVQATPPTSKPKRVENPNFFKEISTGSTSKVPPTSRTHSRTSSSSSARDPVSIDTSARSGHVTQISKVNDPSKVALVSPVSAGSPRGTALSLAPTASQLPQSPVVDHFPPSPVIKNREEGFQQNSLYGSQADLQRGLPGDTSRTQPHSAGQRARNQDMDTTSGALIVKAKACLDTAKKKVKKNLRVNFKSDDQLVEIRHIEPRRKREDPDFEAKQREEEECDRLNEEEVRLRRESEMEAERYMSLYGYRHNDGLQPAYGGQSVRKYDPRKSEFIMEKNEVRDLVSGRYWKQPMMMAVSVTPSGHQSHERHTQAQRESAVRPVEYLSLDHIPDSPAEPDPESSDDTPLPPKMIAMWT